MITFEVNSRFGEEIEPRGFVGEFVFELLGDDRADGEATVVRITVIAVLNRR